MAGPSKSSNLVDSEDDLAVVDNKSTVYSCLVVFDSINHFIVSATHRRIASEAQSTKQSRVDQRDFVPQKKRNDIVARYSPARRVADLDSDESTDSMPKKRNDYGKTIFLTFNLNFQVTTFSSTGSVSNREYRRDLFGYHSNSQPAVYAKEITNEMKEDGN